MIIRSSVLRVVYDLVMIVAEGTAAVLQGAHGTAVIILYVLL